ncbi:hypothetical protein K469DRAFT_491797, partial [Zopfia rhizophila CBS 207.26]
YPNLRKLIDTSSSQKDGIWLCSSCRHKSPLVYCLGDFPFGYLELCCGTCGHHLCKKCLASDIIRPLDMSFSEPIAIPAFTSRKVLYGMVCPECGLT